MKKISILALHLGYGGVEQYISSLCKMLQDDYEIEIISTYRLVEKPVFDFDSKIKISYLINRGPNKELVKKYLKEKKIFKLFKECTISLIILFNKRIKNIKSIRKINSDYIITTRDFHNKLVSKYAKKKIIKIATEHNFHNNDSKYVKRLISSIKNFDYFVLVSETLYNFYKNKIGNIKCVYIPNVLDSIPLKRSKINNHNLICIGRLSPEKGQLDLIEVVKKVKCKINDIKLYIIGDGVLKNKLYLQTKECGLEENIIFTGFLNKYQMEKYILDSSIYLLPSYTESFGLVLIEAMSYGLPCIAFDSSDGAKNLLKNDVGILIKNRNIEEMVNLIIELLQNKQIRENFSNKGYNYCKNYLSINVKEHWNKILK